MRTIVLALLPLLLFACSGKEEEKQAQPPTEQAIEQPMSSAIYICNSPTAETYHNNPNCNGLNRCRYEVVEVTQEEAEDMGRRPCKICY